MVTGTVRWFNDRGLRSITPDEPRKDLFVHHSAIQASGVKVASRACTVSKGPKGPARANVLTL
jgi:cold shock protein